MGNYLTLVVPEEDQTIDTVDAYYRFYFEQMEPYVSASNYQELSEYEFAKTELVDHGLFQISERVFHSVSDQMAHPISELLSEYDSLSGVVTARYVLASLVREFERTRDRLGDNDELDARLDRALQSYVLIVSFAIDRGYGISFP
jgi:hypothetical protein